MNKKTFLILCTLYILGIGTSVAGLENIITMHIQYSLPNTNLERARSENVLQNDNIFELFTQGEIFIKENIIKNLKEQNKPELLGNYVNHGEKILQRMDYEKNHIDTEIQNNEEKIQRCNTELEEANQLFNSSFQENNNDSFLRAIEIGKQARSCLGQEYVIKKSTYRLKDKLDTLSLYIERKINYINENRNTILNHYEILDEGLLTELQNITRTISPR